MRAASLVGLLLRHLPLGLSAAVGSGPAGARTATSAAGRLLPARVASASPLRAARVRASTAELAPLPDDVMLPPPAPEGRSYLPFQLEGIEFAVRRRRVIIADEMGLGKTITAIGTINALQHVKYVLVLCPKSLVLSWESELNRWLTRPFRVMQGLPRDSSPLELGGACVVVINYEMVHKYLPQLHTVRWDMLLCDEAHLLKNPKAIRTRSVLGSLIAPKKGEAADVALEAGYKLFLTGSPLLNRPVELYPLVAAVDPEAAFVPYAGSYNDFVHRYCAPHLKKIPGRNTRHAWDFTGASNEAELREALAGLMLRRLKADVLSNLPPKLFRVFPLESAAVRKAELRALAELASVRGAAGGGADEEAQLDESESAPADPESLSMLDLARAMLTRDEALNTAKSSASALRYAQPVDLLRIMDARAETALAKVPAALELIAALTAPLDGDDGNGPPRKLVVFAHHRRVIAELLAGLGARAVQLTGSCTAESRSEAVERFQTDPSVSVFVGSIRAAGVGLTLTAASQVLFLELDWSPAVMSQAEDRCHRIGQAGNVLVTYLVFQGTLDEKIAEMLVSKQSTINRILPGWKPPTATATPPTPPPSIMTTPTLTTTQQAQQQPVQELPTVDAAAAVATDGAHDAPPSLAAELTGAGADVDVAAAASSHLTPAAETAAELAIETAAELAIEPAAPPTSADADRAALVAELEEARALVARMRMEAVAEASMRRDAAAAAAAAQRDADAELEALRAQLLVQLAAVDEAIRRSATARAEAEALALDAYGDVTDSELEGAKPARRARRPRANSASPVDDDDDLAPSPLVRPPSRQGAS